MGELDRFLREPLLEADASAAFHDARRRVAERHRHWRDNFPAVGLLLDTDEERAHALAGNYATEARETVGVWLSAHVEAGHAQPEKGAGANADARAAWVEGYWAAWRVHVFATPDVERLAGAAASGPRERFTLVFDELMASYRDEAVAYVREPPERSRPDSWARRLTAPLRAVGRALRGFFFPSGP